jgi:hypothetical protein
VAASPNSTDLDYTNRRNPRHMPEFRPIWLLIALLFLYDVQVCIIGWYAIQPFCGKKLATPSGNVTVWILREPSPLEFIPAAGLFLTFQDPNRYYAHVRTTRDEYEGPMLDDVFDWDVKRLVIEDGAVVDGESHAVLIPLK